MKKYFVPVAVLAATIISATAAKKSSDPVLMTVNGKDVPVSEFLYLYQKNNRQQAEPQTLDEYLDMFVKYKLKVADAEAAGLDTTAAFRKEYVGYCDDLAKPYLTDSTVVDRLRHEAYERMKTSRKVSHIMLPAGRTPAERAANMQRLDSIRTAILGGADFGEMAVRYSVDRAAVRNHGEMGWINATGLPFPFVEAAYATPVGQISEPFDDAPYGLHIIRVEDEKANPGQVSARHILKLTRGLSPEEAAVKKHQIDSIYTVLKNGADFADVATRESEDPGSARRGGDLGFFGPGQMVPEFEAAAFSLADGEISEPFATAYGYHIVQTTAHQPVAAFEDCVADIDRQISADSRANLPRKASLEKFRAQLGGGLNAVELERINADIAANSGLDSLLLAKIRQNPAVLATVGASQIKASDVAGALTLKAPLTTEVATEVFANTLNTLLDDATATEARANLAQMDPSYRNLINEYRDGILLFEVSNREVWDRSNKDNEGLEAYFNAHKDNYKWDAPRFKGIIISATTDSIADAAKAYLAANPVGVDSLVQKLRDNFGRNIRIERKVFAQGEDPVVDYLGFNGPNPGQQGKWTGFFLYEGKVLDAPEEAADVRALVVNDYQQWLEQQWLARLEKTYPVKINKKELKKLSK
ncbi:MAG: hypothetical protein HDS11_01280 [Bacteroides sp.]|nr:hypothetical protein [Bacteroides sp.]